VTRIVNGVDTDAFHPANGEQRPDGCPFTGGGLWLIGTVGRLQAVKHQVLLARAFVRMLERSPSLRERIRLVIVGDGPLIPEIRSVLAAGSAQDLAWLPGARNDVPAVLRGLDVFVLPSLAEGISNTILEAMASGLPVVATDVGGNAELVAHGETGTIVPTDDADALAEALLAFARDADAARAAGRASRVRAERLFSLDAMVAQYAALYERLLRGRKSRAAAGSPLHATSGSR
jgi:sugar transferase (PEP-CTERM/EpsH1 system associated)